jgi:RNA methyltransferase, TrmH family
MLSKNEIKYIQSLVHKKNRDAENVFVVEGVKAVNELLRSNFTVANVYAVAQWIHETGNNATLISGDELIKISKHSTPNMVLAVAYKKKLLPVPSFENKITLALDGIQDPGNMGTIIRIADWFGIENIIASKDSADFYNPKVIQAGMGSFIRINTWYNDLQPILETAAVPVFGAVMNGGNIFDTPKPAEGILLIGNEGQGLRNNLLPFINHKITIPKKGNAESLNAAVAAGIILAHII